jgi:prepilin-type N-terminal cleavage/methylation domain-containing protein
MRGFTLLELLLVLFVLGVVLGSAMVLAGRFEPGPVGLRSATEAFFASSRERARATGLPVVVDVVPAEDGFGRLRRLVARTALEASFEAGTERRHGLQPSDGGVSIGEVAGRFGAAAAIDGGSLLVEGRGGRVFVGEGFTVDLHLRAGLDRASPLLRWAGLCEIRLGRDGSLRVRLDLEEGAGLDLRAPAAVRPERWHHLVLEVADGRAELRVDGAVLAGDVYETPLAAPTGALVLGDTDGSFRGLVDELTVSSRVEEFGPDLRAEADLLLGAPRIRFGGDGHLDPSHGEGVRVDLIHLGESAGAFLVGRFAEQEVGG